MAGYTVRYEAMKRYVERMGGDIRVSGDTVEIYIPVVVEEVAGGVQFQFIGRLRGDELLLEKCYVRTEEEKREVHLEDLVPWINYINKVFS